MLQRQGTPWCVELVERCEVTAFARLHLMLLAAFSPGAPGLVAEIAQAQQAGIAWVGDHAGNRVIEPWCFQAIEVMGIEGVLRAGPDPAVRWAEDRAGWEHLIAMPAAGLGTEIFRTAGGAWLSLVERGG